MSETPPPYGAPQPDPYGQPYPGQPYYRAPDHPQATTVLVLGVLGLVLCQLLSPVAWVMGSRVVREIDAGGGRVGGRGSANAGRICGMVGTILIGVSLAFLLVFLVIAVAASAA